MATIISLSACFAPWLILVYTITPETLRLNPNNILAAINAKPVYDLCRKDLVSIGVFFKVLFIPFFN